MRKGPIEGILAFLLLLSTGSALGAQQHASRSIDGFNHIPWGASEADIREAFGEPVQVDSLDNGIVVLAYREDLLGHPAVALYALFGEDGLVKGQHVTKLRLDEGDCEGQYRVYRDHVTLTYPLIVPVENFDFPFTEDFCTAVQKGEGEWVNQWTDPSNGAVATVVVQRGSDEVLLVFESAAFLNWLGPDNPPES